VLRDESFEKAMALVRRATDEVLHPRLVAAIAELAGRAALDPAGHARYLRLLSFLAREPGDLLAASRDQPLLRTVSGPALTLTETIALIRRQGRLLCAATGSALTDHLQETGVPVLDHPVTVAGSEAVGARSGLEVLLRRVAWAGRGGVLGRIQHWLGLTDGLPDLEVVAPEAVMVGVVPDPEPPTPELRALVAGAAGLLETVGQPFRRLTTFVIAAPTADPPLVVSARQLHRFMTIPPRWRQIGAGEDRPEAAINREHPHLVALLALAGRAPGLACWCLARVLLVEQDREAEVDLGLLRAARPETWPRPGAEVRP
jgi:hypothetical protein